MSMKMNTLGSSRSLLNKFNELKKANNINGSRLSDNNNLLSDNGKTSLLGEKKKQNKSEIEIGFVKNQQLMDFFDSTNRLFKEINNLYNKLVEEQQLRIMPRFDDSENHKINKNINEIVDEITSKIKQCEENIRKISNSKNLTSVEIKMKENIKINLATKLQEVTRKIRNNEENYMSKVKELGVDDNNMKTTGDLHNNPNEFLDLTMEANARSLVERNSQINSIVKSVTELSQIFKDMSVLVNEQGTILDRIDYNIEIARDNVKNANESLLKTEKMVESGCARKVIMILIVIIFVECLIMLYKFS